MDDQTDVLAVALRQDYQARLGHARPTAGMCGGAAHGLRARPRISSR